MKQVKMMVAREEKFYVMFYSLYPPFVLAAADINSEYPFAHITMIQTDAVPGRNDMRKYMTPKNKRSGDFLVRKAKVFDDFIIISNHLREPLEVGNRKSIVLECICDETQVANIRKHKSDNIFFYAGALEEEYGFVELVQAFAQLPSCQLWVCGKGSSEKLISQAAEKYDNIKYFGFVTQEEVNNLRDNCDFLLNPRRPTGTYTKYSFPSKTSEYLMSEKPTVMYKLEGIPDEYDEFITYLHEITPEGIAKEINGIVRSSYSKYLLKAAKGREFMLKNKKADIFAKKIISMLDSTEENI